MYTLPPLLVQALKRRRNPWNWLIQIFAVLLLCMALWATSTALYSTGLILLGSSLFELHLPEMQTKKIWKLMRLERTWLESPATKRKKLQILALMFLVALLFYSLAVHDLALLLLAIGGFVLFATEAAQHSRLAE